MLQPSCKRAARTLRALAEPQLQSTMPACVRLDDLRISCGPSTSPRQIGILRCNQLPPTVAPGVHIEKAQSKVEKLRALAALQLADPSDESDLAHHTGAKVPLFQNLQSYAALGVGPHDARAILRPSSRVVASIVESQELL